MTSADKHPRSNIGGSNKSWPMQSPDRPNLSSPSGNAIMTPSPPPHPPAHARRPRSMRSQRLNSARSVSSDERPTSSALGKYPLLPPIDPSRTSTPDESEQLAESTRKLSISKPNQSDKTEEQPPLSSIRIPTAGEDDNLSGTDDSVVPNSGKRKNRATDSQKRKTMRTLSLSDEPQQPPRLQLGIKLTDGRQLRRYFRPHEPLQMVMDFAEQNMGINLTGYTLVKNAPATEFNDLSVALKDASIEDRTLLYLQTPAPE